MRRLVRLAALIAVGGGEVSIAAAASADFGARASARAERIVAVLLAIGPEAGAGRIVGAAPHVAAASGYDMDAHLERL